MLFPSTALDVTPSMNTSIYTDANLLVQNADKSMSLLPSSRVGGARSVSAVSLQIYATAIIRHYTVKSLLQCATVFADVQNAAKLVTNHSIIVVVIVKSAECNTTPQRSMNVI